MIEDDLFELMDSVLHPLGATSEPGDESRDPPLEILGYYARPARISAVPILGRGVGVVAVCRQPVDVDFARGGYRTLVERAALVVNTRFPPLKKGRGLVLGLTIVALTPEPIGADEEKRLDSTLGPVPRARAVPLGVLRVNLGQEAFSFALRSGPGDVFPEPSALADAFAVKLRRFVPLLEF